VEEKNMIESNRKRSGTEKGRRNLYIVGNNKPTPPTPPAASRFVPKHDREAWADIWLRGGKNLFQLTYSNKGFGLLGIEQAIREVVLDRIARAERLERNVVQMRGRAA
jgi:hypothetical protein